jgi:glycerol-3-phosphate responsive antiterminator
VRNIRGLKAQNKEILEALDTIQGMLATKHSALGLLEDDPFDGIISAQDRQVVQEIEIVLSKKYSR